MKIVGPYKAEEVYQRDGYQCLCCRSAADLTVDHIIPRSDGGTNGMENLQTLCKTCNLVKSTLHINFKTDANSLWGEKIRHVALLLKNGKDTTCHEYQSINLAILKERNSWIKPSDKEPKDKAFVLIKKRTLAKKPSIAQYLAKLKMWRLIENGCQLIIDNNSVSGWKHFTDRTIQSATE